MKVTQSVLIVAILFSSLNAISLLFKDREAEREAEILLRRNHLLAKNRHRRSDKSSDDSHDDFSDHKKTEAEVKIPLKTHLRPKKDDEDCESESDRKWKQIGINATIIPDEDNKGKKSANLIDNHAPAKQTIKVERVGKDPEDIKAPLNIEHVPAHPRKKDHSDKRSSRRDNSKRNKRRVWVGTENN